jgi:hypothetical protein
MIYHLSLRTKAANNGGAGKQTDWRADKQLSQRAQADSQDEG